MTIPADTTAFLRDLFVRLEKSTHARLGRTTSESLHWQIDREANSVGVTVWHSTRWLDALGTVALPNRDPEDQHWFRDGWAERTGYDPRGLGAGGLGNLTGYTVDEMLAVPKLSAEDLGAYHHASVASLLDAIAREDTSSLQRTIVYGGSESSCFELLLGIALGETRHLGEIDALLALYVRRQERSTAGR